MRTLLSVLLALTLLAAACSSGEPRLVATVGTTEITEEDLGALYEADVLPVDEQLRQSIFALVARQVFLREMEAEFGVELDTDEVDVLYDQLVADIEEAGATPGDVLGIPDASLQMVRFNAELGVIRDQVVDLLVADPETISTFFSDPTSHTTVCVRHLLVETEDEALAARERLEDGEAFAEVASELSLDTGTPDGDLGCSLAGRYVPEFAAASLETEVGELSEPVQTDFGYHLLIVDERSAPTEDELVADPEAYLTDQELTTLWAGWFNEQLQEAEVTIEERYGSWSPVGILPPESTSDE